MQVEIALSYLAEVQKDKEEAAEKATETETKAVKAFSTPLVSGASIVLDSKASSTPLVSVSGIVLDPQRAPGKRRRTE